MTGLEVLLAVAGLVVTALVVTGMILITPHGDVNLHAGEAEAQGANLSRAGASEAPPAVPASS